MANIVIVFPKPEDARSIRNLLVRNGYSVSAVCTSGLQALGAVDRLNSGVIVCGYRYPDMMYDELYENLPPSFEMLLIASQRVIGEGICEGVVSVSMPLRVSDLVNSLEMIIDRQERRRLRKRTLPPKRSDEEKRLIADAKALLMTRNNMTEEEAHRYLQKTSMDSGTNLVETAQMLFALMKD
ncbi:MAG: ANTAR domain-containing protein [Lachnospiraceae bacterium]|nr:ANTAR domain-containing protein [Lachnospiraceae bacterium]